MPFPDLGAEPRGFPANALRCPEAIGRRLVGVPGLEPGTSSLSGTRSNQLSYTPGKGRTPGERVASQAESELVEPGGFEPPTAWLQTRCSGRLSYDPGTASEEARQAGGLPEC